MSQERTDDLAVYLGLQGFEVESVERVEQEGIKIVHLLRRSGRYVCSGCGKSFTESLFDEHERVRFRDCSIGDVPTYLEIRAVRVACCGGTRTERLPFVMAGFRVTRRFFERIAALCTRLPVLAVAEMAGLSWDTVARIDKRAIEMGLGDQDLDLGKLRWIGVDEVTRTGGHVYFTIVTDMLEWEGCLDRRRQGRERVEALPRGAGAQGTAPDPRRGERPGLPHRHQRVVAQSRPHPRSIPHRPVDERGAQSASSQDLLGGSRR